MINQKKLLANVNCFHELFPAPTLSLSACKLRIAAFKYNGLGRNWQAQRLLRSKEKHIDNYFLSSFPLQIESS